MSTLDYIGISPKSATSINSKLNDLLANLQLFYTNVRGLHWDIEGHQFFTLHAKFEELYNDLAEKIDSVAERILMLGGKPVNNFSAYLKTSDIKEVTGVTCDHVAIEHILAAFKIIIAKERHLMEITDEAGDYGTNDMINGFINGQEKMVWMYDAFLTCGCNADKEDKKKKK